MRSTIEIVQLVRTKIGKHSIEYAYDSFGRPISCKNDSHEQIIVYDNVGNIESVTEQIDGLSFSKSIAYDKLGRPVSSISPTGMTLKYNYDSFGNIDGLTCDGNHFWSLLEVDEKGKPAKETYGDIVRTTKYDHRGLPVLDDVKKLMHYEYLFDDNCDMLQKKETYSNQEEVYLFDKHNRLNKWRTFEKDTLRKEIFADYDDIFGNIISRSDSDFVFNYGEYGMSPHALTSIDAPINGHEGRTNNYSYTDFKMLESATNGEDSIHITYGVDFQRRKMQVFRKDSLILTRYYFSDYEEEHYADGRIRKIDYITGPTGLLGVNISSDGEDSLLYAFTDRFGNLTLLVDNKGEVVDRLAYDPWGARRNPDDWTKPDTSKHILSRGYSMHEHLDNLGLINMNARVYEPATCSFLSPDPLIADEGNWMNYNRYLYCLGNPVKFVDPTGMEVEDVDDLINYYKKLSGTISGVISDCIGLGDYKANLCDIYTSIDYTPTSTVIYNGQIPVGENYRNSSSGFGGCTEASILSVLDMFKIENQSVRIQLNYNREKDGWNQNVKNTFDGLKIEEIVCDVIGGRESFVSLINSMKDDGYVYAANIVFYNENREKYGHNVVVTGVRGNMIQYWDNSKGRTDFTYKNNIQELYRFNMSGYNPWLPERINIIIQSNSLFSW